jgi:putative membrane protein insertion efficiency factor
LEELPGTVERMRIRGVLLEQMLVRILSMLVVLYRITLGVVLGGNCRFQPTCSQYALDALRIHGARKGTWMTIRRLARCHPLGGSGWDPA